LAITSLAKLFIAYLPASDPVVVARKRAVYATERQRIRAEQTRAWALVLRRQERERHVLGECCSIQ